jgi:hypothetical protein
MGLIRKSLYLGTGGLVGPNSKKQRLQMQQLAALQGATPQEIKRRGGRYDFDGLVGLAPGSVRGKTVTGQPSGTSRPHGDKTNDGRLPETTIQLSCGHVVLITDPQTIRWLSAEGELSYRCSMCHGERSIVAVGEDAIAMRADEDAPASRQLLDDLERLRSLHVSGALTDTEFQAAKSRLLGE